MSEITKTVYEDRNLTILTVTGDVTPEQILDALGEFYGSGFTERLLWDFSGATAADFPSKGLEEILAFARNHAHLRTSGKTAIVVSGVLGFGMGRMYSILSEVKGHPIPHRVFRDMNEAITWLET